MKTHIMRSIDQPMPFFAVIAAALAFFFFAALDSSAKWLVMAGYAIIFVVWIRFFVQALFLIILYRGWRNKRLWHMQHPVLQILRGLLLPTMTGFNFLALKSLQLAETVSVLLATPIVVAALSGPLLGEWVGPRRWVAIIVGFIGILIIVRPGTEVFTLPVVFIIISMLAYSFYFVLTRKLASIETPESLIFYSSFFAVIGFAPFALQEAALPANVVDWFAFGFAGLAGMIGHMLLIKASSLTDISKVAPFTYTQAIWMTISGFYIFGDIPDFWTFFGMGVIIASGLYLMMRERSLSYQGQANRSLEK